MKILLGVDGSIFSKAANQAVMEQARPQSDEVRVVHVVDILTIRIPDGLAYYPGIEHSRDSQRRIAETLVADAAKSLRSSGLLQVTTDIEWGNPKSKIIDNAAEWRADLIVLGSHGRTGLDRFLMGSVADAVMRHAHCSVELVRILPGANGTKDSYRVPEGKFTRILLAIDDSRFSEAAIRMVCEQLHSLGTKLRVLHVVEPPALLVAREMGGYDPTLEHVWEAQTREAEDLVTKVAKKFCGTGLEVTTCVAQGDPKTKILDEAQEWKADLIVIGSHGRAGVARFLMGSVSEAVAHHAHCSVEVVRSTSSIRLQEAAPRQPSSKKADCTA
ncbi:MAG TPA: universal stress protein, partial [Terriglobales bacterium]|nr:universal stress protein [Terriglobales bacterium]